MKTHSGDGFNESKPTSNTKKMSGISNKSLIVYLLECLSNIIYDAFTNGFFGRIFTAYSSELDSYHNGFVYSCFRGGRKTRAFFRKTRAYLSKSFETSVILTWLKRYVCSLTDVPIRSYGIFLTSFGVYTLLVYFIKALVPMAGNADTDYLIIGACVCLISTPLHFSRSTLAGAVRKSKLMGSFFVEALGYRDELFEMHDSKRVSHSGVPILCGLIFGVLTFILHPLSIIITLISLVVISMIMMMPEIGILLCLFGLPFFSLFESPTFILLLSVAVTTFSFLVKLVRGKRILKFELLDFTVLAFAAMVLLSGIVSVGGKSSYYASLISVILICGYFLIVNLIRTEKWLKRCVVALVASGSVTALIGIAQYLLGAVTHEWLDTSYFSAIQGRATSLFENPNFLSAYLAMILPFALYQYITGKYKKERLLYFFCCIMILICDVLTWSRGSWLAVVICTFLFFLIFSRKTLKWLLSAVFVVPFLPFILPQSVVSRFMSIGDMADSSTSYRVYTWQGSLKMIKEYLWGGIGYGTSTFSEVYPLYAYAGIEAAPHSHNLYMQIILGMGIGGLICLFLIVLFYAQHSFEYIQKPWNQSTRILTISAFVAVMSMLIMGMFDYVWYNYRMFFMFWVVLALGVCSMKIGNKEIKRKNIVLDTDMSSAVIDIEF